MDGRLIGITIAGGEVTIETGGALWGYGTLAPNTLENRGTIMANDFYRSARGLTGPDDFVHLTVHVNPMTVNAGEMVATAGHTLTLNAPVYTALDNAGTADNPGYLRVHHVTPISGGGIPVNGHMQINNMTVVGGVLEVRGAYLPPDNPPVPFDYDLRATVDGANVILENVQIDVSRGVLRAMSAGQTFEIKPQPGLAAKILGSVVIAESGGIMKLSSMGALQEYHMHGTDIIARSGNARTGIPPAANSRIEIDRAWLVGGQLFSQNSLGAHDIETGGEIHVVGDARFSNVYSQANVKVMAGKTLALDHVYFNHGYVGEGEGAMPSRNGSLTVAGTLLLKGSTPIGGGNMMVPFVQSGSDLLGGKVNIQAGAKIEVEGIARILGADLTNNGLINVNDWDHLTIHTSGNNALPGHPSFDNPGTVIVDAGQLEVDNPMMTNTGLVEIRGGMVPDMPGGEPVPVDGSLTVNQYRQAAGNTVLGDMGIIYGNALVTGGRFRGIGTITGDVDVTGGVLEPGLSVGTLTIGGSLSFHGAHGTLEYELDSDNVLADLINVGGNLDIAQEEMMDAAMLSLTDLGDALLESGTKFTLISYAGAWNGGTFNMFPQMQTFMLGRNEFRIQYNDTPAGSRNGGAYSKAVTLTLVPEPSSLILIALGSWCAVLAMRRRNR
jgi:hypothetical protein